MARENKQGPIMNKAGSVWGIGEWQGLWLTGEHMFYPESFCETQPQPINFSYINSKPLYSWSLKVATNLI